MIDFVNEKFFEKYLKIKLFKIKKRIYYTPSDDFSVIPYLEFDYLNILESKLRSLNLKYPDKCISPDTPYSERLIEKLIKNTLSYGPIESFDLIRRRLNEEETDLAYLRGYRLHNLSSVYMLNNIYAIRKEVENYNKYEVLRYTEIEIPHEYIDIFLEKGYQIIDDVKNIERIGMLKNEYAVRKAILKHKQAYLLKNYVYEHIDSEILKAYINQGNDPKDIMNQLNPKVFKELVINFKRADLLKEKNKYISDELIEEFFNQGNKLDIHSNYLLYSSYAIHLSLKKYKDPSILDLEVAKVKDDDLKYAVSLGYKPNRKTIKFRLYDDDFDDYYISKIDLTDDLKRILNLLGKTMFVCSYEEVLKNSDIFKYFTDHEIFMIIKYYYLNEKITQNTLFEIINNQDLSLVQYINSILNKEFDINYFIIICENYKNYKNLYLELKETNLASLDIVLLKNFLLNTFEKKNRIEINTYDELLNYRETVIKKRKECIDDELYKRVIYEILLNKNSDKIFDLFYKWFRPDKIEALMNSIQNKKIYKELECYLSLMEFIDEFRYCKDEEYLRSLSIKLANLEYENSSDLEKLKSLFYQIEDKARLYYSEELRESLIQFDKLEGKKGVKVRKNLYHVDDFEYEGEIIPGTNVDLIDIYNYPFVTLVHKMNAYGKGGKIKYFKETKNFGTPYICLTALDETYKSTAGHNESKTIDDVELLFNDFELEQFIAASESDLYSKGDKNSLDISFKKHLLNMKPVRDIVKWTYNNRHNEYILLRESFKGNLLYPGAIKVEGKYPTLEEIKAAAYLKVPLVRIHKKRYIFTKRPNIIKKENIHECSITNLDLLQDSIDIINNLTNNRLVK